MLAALGLALLAGGVPHDIRATGGNAYVPEGLRVAPGDAVRWAATGVHPLRFDGEAGGPHTAGLHVRTLAEPGRVAYHCAAHGGPDGQGMSGVVTVGTANEPPTTRIEREGAAARPGDAVTLRALSADFERIALRHDWDLDGDGRFERPSASTVVSATYGPGSHVVRVRVTDDLGASAEADHAFSIAGPCAVPPAAAPPDSRAPAPAPEPGVEPGAPPAITVAAASRISRRALRERGLHLRIAGSPELAVRAELRDAHGRRLASRVVRLGRRAARLRLRAAAADGPLRLRVRATDPRGRTTTVARSVVLVGRPAGARRAP